MRLRPYIKKDFSGGQANNLNISLLPPNTVDLAVNVEFDYEVGSATTRLGTENITASDQLVNNKSILGLVQHVDQSDTSKNKLFATVNDGSDTNADIYDVAAGTKSLQDDTKDLKTYFLNYQGDTLRLNGTDAVKAYNSTSWLTTGGVFDLGNMPAAYKYPKEFLDRVYLWGKGASPYTLAYSGVLTSNAVSWTSGNGTVEIEPEDGGGEGTGLGKVPGYILIFKRRSMHRWNFSSAFPESLVNIGAYSQESIVEGGGLCAFYSDSNENAKGFYITNGGRPVPISHDNNRPIKKWVDAISSSATVAGWATDRVFAWTVGDLTVDGETWNNVVLRYNRILNQWSVRTYPTQFTIFAPYVTSGVHTIVGGEDDGTVYRLDKIDTFKDALAGNTQPIPWTLRDNHNTFGFNQLKKLTDAVVVRGKNIKGIAANAITDEEKRIPMGSPSLKRKLLSVLKIGKTIEGTTISVEVSGQASGARTVISEIELPFIDVLENYA